MQKLLLFFIPRLAWFYLILVGKTSKIVWQDLKIREDLEIKFNNFIYAFWHGRQFLIPWAYRYKNHYCLVSQSKDGEYIARVMRLFGLKAIRGSSSRGAVRALVELKKKLENGKTIGLTPDGPRGPKGLVAPGILFLAQKTKKPILPLTYSAKLKLIFHGWDDYWIPLPFNKIVIHYGNPIFVSPENELTEKAEELAGELNRITEEADQIASKKTIEQWFKKLLENFLFGIYNSCLLLFSPFILLSMLFYYRDLFFNHLFKGLKERLALLPTLAFTKPPLWVHAASLGEARAAYPFIRALKEKYPDQPIVFTSNTLTGVNEGRKLELGELNLFAPMDFPWVTKRFFKIIKPKMILLLESEIWPNWLRVAKKSNIPVAIINGRISKKSASRYLKIKILIGLILKKIELFLCREKEDGERFEKIGALKTKIFVTGNLKFDSFSWEFKSSQSKVPIKQEFLNSLNKNWRLLVTGSIRDGEENLLIETYLTLIKKHTDLKLLLAPRHMEQLPLIKKLLEKNLLCFVLKSQAATETNPKKDWDVLIWDTFGDLWQAYQSASIIFIGGSLVALGGQNPIEPASFSKPILFGPCMENFSEPAKLLLESNGAIQVQDQKELCQKIEELLSSPEKIIALGRNANEVVQKLKGKATNNTLELLKKYL
ncbi:MAG: DUF374 domain-containing protein [Elusimicrobia bacterium]|nr:DUF374 domain-containing protein [Elusimicrobiota bacterium]